MYQCKFGYTYFFLNIFIFKFFHRIEHMDPKHEWGPHKKKCEITMPTEPRYILPAYVSVVKGVLIVEWKSGKVEKYKKRYLTE